MEGENRASLNSLYQEQRGDMNNWFIILHNFTDMMTGSFYKTKQTLLTDNFKFTMQPLGCHQWFVLYLLHVVWCDVHVSEIDDAA